MARKNPLLKNFEVPPFSKIREENYKPAFKEAIKNTQKEIDEIIQNPASPNFKNTIEALEYSGHQLSRITSLFFNLNAAETTPEIQRIAQEISPWLSKHHNDLMLNEELFKRVQKVYANRQDLNLSPE